MSDQYAWYRAKLRGEAPPIHDSSPQCGYFKRRISRGGAFIAAAIWSDGSGLQCRVGDALVDVHDEWIWLAGRPIPEADARFWFENKRWPDQPDMAVSRINIADLAKAWKFARSDVSVIEAVIEAAARAYASTGKLPPGFEIISTKEVAA